MSTLLFYHSSCIRNKSKNQSFMGFFLNHHFHHFRDKSKNKEKSVNLKEKEACDFGLIWELSRDYQMHIYIISNKKDNEFLKSLCVCVVLCVCMPIHMCAYPHVRGFVDQRWIVGVSFLHLLSTLHFRKSLTEPEAFCLSLSGMAGLRDPRSLLSLLPTSSAWLTNWYTVHCFYLDSWDPNSASHVCAASTLPTEPPHQSRLL